MVAIKIFSTVQQNYTELKLESQKIRNVQKTQHLHTSTHFFTSRINYAMMYFQAVN